jgi:hypothetical protein
LGASVDDWSDRSTFSVHAVAAAAEEEDEEEEEAEEDDDDDDDDSLTRRPRLCCGSETPTKIDSDASARPQALRRPICWAYMRALAAPPTIAFAGSPT